MGFDVVVIGQGFAGLTAARLAHERGLRTANVEAMYAGGLVMNVNHLDPAPPGGENGGADLVSTLAMENMDLGIGQVNSPVTALTPAGDGWKVGTGEGTTLDARHVILATGARLRKLGVPGEAEFLGRGVSECADCDGPMFTGMDAVVVGGGDSACQEAVALARFAGRITLVLRGDAPRARPDLAAAVRAEPRIALRPHTRVTAIEGDAGGVTGVRIDSGELLPCAGVFVFVGLDPQADFLPAGVARDATGAVVTDAVGRTALPGLWAVGAVRSGFGGLLTDAQAEAQRLVAALA